MMSFLAKKRFAALIPCLALLLQGCAPNFVHPALFPNQSQTHTSAQAHNAVIDSFTMQTNSSPAEQAAMRKSVAQAIYQSGIFSVVNESPQDSSQDEQHLRIRIVPEFRQHFGSLWYLGLLCLGPAWPIMPRSGEIGYTLSLTIMHNQTTLQTLNFEERDTFDLFLYGPYRQTQIQQQTDFLLQKLLAHLTSALQQEFAPNTDGDASGIELN